MLKCAMLAVSVLSARNLYTDSLIGKGTGLASEDDNKGKTFFLHLKTVNDRDHLNTPNRSILISKDCHASNYLS